jgi:hypothetical protein
MSTKCELAMVWLALNDIDCERINVWLKSVIIKNDSISNTSKNNNIEVDVRNLKTNDSNVL